MPRSRFVEFVYRRPGLALLLLLPVGLLASLYVASFGDDYAFEPRHPGLSRWYNIAEGAYATTQYRIEGNE